MNLKCNISSLINKFRENQCKGGAEMAAINKGLQAHDHALNVLELLYHEFWNKELMVKIKNELEKAYLHLKEHVYNGECVCGDREKDLQFYGWLYEEMKEAVAIQSMAVVPVLRDELLEYFKTKDDSHHCIQELLLKKHTWVEDFA
jgi:hypothetical protein